MLRLLSNRNLDTTVLSTASSVIVANDRLRSCSTLSSDLRTINTLLYEVSLCRLSSLKRKRLVDSLATSVVSVTYDLDRCVAVTLNILSDLVEEALSVVAKVSRTQLKVATLSSATFKATRLIEVLVKVLTSLAQLLVDLIDLVRLTLYNVLDSNSVDAVDLSVLKLLELLSLT